MREKEREGGRKEGWVEGEEAATSTVLLPHCTVSLALFLIALLQSAYGSVTYHMANDG